MSHRSRDPSGGIARIPDYSCLESQIAALARPLATRTVPAQRISDTGSSCTPQLSPRAKVGPATNSTGIDQSRAQNAALMMAVGAFRATGSAAVIWCAAKESNLQPTEQETLTAASTKRLSRNASRKPAKTCVRSARASEGTVGDPKERQAGPPVPHLSRSAASTVPGFPSLRC